MATGPQGGLGAMKPAEFKPPGRILGRGGVSIGLVKNVFKFLNSLRNIQVKSTGRDVVHYSDDGILIEVKGGGEAPGTPLGTLVLVQTAADTFRVTWGVVELKVPTAIGDEITLSGADGDRYVWLEITMQTVSPFSVISATVEHGTEYPDPETPDPDPPATVYFPLGVVNYSGGEIQSISNTNGPFGGSIGISLVKTGSVCVSADPGDPEADPIIPATNGGIVDTFNWATYRK